jgi:hypothetical protein
LEVKCLVVEAELIELGAMEQVAEVQKVEKQGFGIVERVLKA